MSPMRVRFTEIIGLVIRVRHEYLDFALFPFKKEFESIKQKWVHRKSDK